MSSLFSGYAAATFQYNNEQEGLITFDLSSYSNVFSSSFDLSFFIRTRQSRALVMFFGSYNENSPSSSTFITLELESGHLGVGVKFCDFSSYLMTNGDNYNNGNQHLVRLKKDGTDFSFYVDNIPQEYISLPSVSCNFNSQDLKFGGWQSTSSSGRKKREILTRDPANFTLLDSYKGTVQDVQMNDQYTLQLYDLRDSNLTSLNIIQPSLKENLQQGEVTDALCDQLMPCQNNATCEDKFFNDYR